MGVVLEFTHEALAGLAVAEVPVEGVGALTAIVAGEHHHMRPARADPGFGSGDQPAADAEFLYGLVHHHGGDASGRLVVLVGGRNIRAGETDDATIRHGNECGMVGVACDPVDALPHLIDGGRVAEFAEERGERREVPFGEGSDRDVCHDEPNLCEPMSGADRWPDLAGRLIPGGHVLPVRVYFEDTDFSGVVYHGAYFRFMERGRSDFLRRLGVGHDALDRGEHGEPLAFTVRRIAAEFLRPARIDDVLEVETRSAQLGGARIVLTQTVRRGDEVLVTAEVTVAMINGAGQARRLPDAVRAALVGEDTP